MTELRIGTSGWNYPHWRGTFYPKGLPHRRELEYLSTRMNSVEINGSFYSLQRPSSYRKWADETPPGFVFAVKGGRFITHMRKLRDIRVPLANFFASGLLLLGEKLGPILWQFPPQWSYNRERVLDFLEMLPQTSTKASILAAGHQLPSAGYAWIEPIAETRIRHAFEVRHPSFFTEDFVDLLREYNVALVFADTAGTWPYSEDITGDFVYVRLHGADQLYASVYTDEQLGWWADRVCTWRSGFEPLDASRIAAEQFQSGIDRDVFIYFDNDIGSHAPFDAIKLKTMLAD